MVLGVTLAGLLARGGGIARVLILSGAGQDLLQQLLRVELRLGGARRQEEAGREQDENGSIGAAEARSEMERAASSEARIMGKVRIPLENGPPQP